MGKRELLLIVGFVMVAAVVYQATAPPADPDRRDTWSTVINHIRREIRGNRASTEVVKSDVHPLDPGTIEVRLTPSRATGNPQLAVVGEDREDIASVLQVWSNGYDEAEAKTLAEQTSLKYSQAGGSAIFTVTYPEPGSQRATLTLKVPSRLRVHVAGRAAQRQSIRGVAGVEAPDLRGNTTIENISGRVAVTHRGGEISIVDVGSLKLTTRGSDTRLEGVRGDIALQVQGGELRGTGLAGPIEIDASASDVTLDKLESTGGPIRINATAGRVTLRGLGTEARIDGRNADLEIDVARAAPITIYSEGEDVEITPPPGGYTLDATVTDGELTVADGSIEVAPVDREQRAAGPVRGGGAQLTLRVTRGDVRVRTRELTRVER